MFNDRLADDERKSRIVLFSADSNFINSARSAFAAKAISGVSIIEQGLSGRIAERALCDAAIMIVDIGEAEESQKDLLELQHLIGRVGQKLPVVVIVNSFNEIVARKLVQMQVADILIKPVAPLELVRTCARLMRTKTEESQIYTFLPVAGGVGTTTLSIQTALTLLDGKGKKKSSTCLVDLNFYHGASPDYLDIEGRLNLKEIELKPERLDRQLLEGMLSHHPSGLAVIATPNLPTEIASVPANIVMGLLNIVCQSFDQIIVDMPKTWELWTENVLLGSNKLFLVSEATVPGLRKAKQLLQDISTQLGPRTRPNVIVNRVKHQLFGAGLRRADLVKALGSVFVCAVPYNYKLVREAIDRGIPLDDVQKNSDIAVAIRRLIAPPNVKFGSLFPTFGRSPAANRAQHATLTLSQPSVT